jgi:hypothetical protein
MFDTKRNYLSSWGGQEQQQELQDTSNSANQTLIEKNQGPE